ncbi:MAG TPA: PSD1 and planctomycete cytochrome C domain-containing protein [Methylomirabilota bacterium]|nr:PSD1 and planctomycete cytochrome C domain-containing protein [Methylomirabilota bacterium]
MILHNKQRAAARTLLAIFLTGLSAAAAEIQFNRDIRPILSDNCFACHGPDKGTRKGKLRLDDRAQALGKEAIVPGNPEKSELVKRIFTTDPDDQMPPADSHKQLTAEQKELLKQWVAQGAAYEPHWAYIKPTRVKAPEVRARSWARNPIDAFILAKLEGANIAPSPEADKRTLLRRLSLDLTGLPPTPEEMSRFLANKDNKAVEKEVERLLKSPHYGERMAAPWLDVVRFSDTVGYHGDQNQRIFPYRDYVINAFNSNKPFDQFTIEQIAGDLLPSPTTEQLVATGFNRLNMMTREGGAQPKEYLAKYAADRVRTVSTAWLGATLGCAECHDHKFDPFSTKDFYAMEAFFADIKQWGVYSDYSYTPNPDLKGWSNDHPFPPEIQVQSPYLKRREQQLRAELAALAENALRSGPVQLHFTSWLETSKAFLKANRNGWFVPSPKVSIKAKKADQPKATEARVESDNSIILTGNSSEMVEVQFSLQNGTLAAIKLELLPDQGAGGKILRQGSSATINLTASLTRDGKSEKISFHDAQANFSEPRYSNGHEILDVRDAWRVDPNKLEQPHTAVWLIEKPLEVREGDALTVTINPGSAARLRVSASPFAFEKPWDPEAQQAAITNLLKASDAPERQIAALHLASTGAHETAFAEYKKLRREILECRNGLAWTMITEAQEPLVTRVLPRGNWQDESGEVVQPATPGFLPQLTGATPNRLNRLDLAKWIVSPENPLTARTMVNRLWKQFFGAGLSVTVDDLGWQGEAPSHPELLDWLAVEFMESGWDVKHMVQLMVTSATYRQSSNLRKELQEIDPNNRLLASQNPRRLEAEFVRDNALSIARLIDREIGGPSAHPYQPPGYYVNLQFPDRDYHPSRDARQYRRGIYAHWQRTFLQPMLANFDAPSREECTAFRVVSNTPQQALTLLNDPTFAEAARVFAQQTMESAADDKRRLQAAYLRALGRPPQANEAGSLLKFLAQQREHYGSSPQEAEQLTKVGIAPTPERLDKVELAAWTQVCRAILNLHETITIY